MSSEPRSMSLRYALAGALAMAIGMGIGRFAYTPILPGMMEGLGLTASDAGLIASANYVGYLIGAILAGGGWGQGRERSMAYLGTGGTAVLTAAMGFDRRHACVSADPVRRRYRQCLYDDFPLDHHFQSVGSHPAGWLAEPAFWRRWLGYHSIGHRDRSGLCAGFGLANELVCRRRGQRHRLYGCCLVDGR